MDITLPEIAVASMMIWLAYYQGFFFGGMVEGGEFCGWVVGRNYNLFRVRKSLRRCFLLVLTVVIWGFVCC